VVPVCGYRGADGLHILYLKANSKKDKGEKVMKPKYIVIEGMGGSGKTTLSNKLFNYIRDIKREKVFITKEPGSPLLPEAFKIFRKLLLENEYIKDNPELQLFMFLTDRYIHIDKVVKKGIKDGYNIISDRNFISNTVYQGLESKLYADKVYEMHENVLLMPDYFIFMDISAEVAYERIMNRGNLHNFNKVNIDTLKKRREYYNYCVQRYIPYDKIIKIDATKNMDDILDMVIERLE
jgi:dTMP kinase